MNKIPIMFSLFKNVIDWLNNTSSAHVEDDSIPILSVKRLHPDAKLPTKGSAAAAGYDLYALVPDEDRQRSEAVPVTNDSGVECENDDFSRVLFIEPGSRLLVRTGLAVIVPDDFCYARIAPRSGLAAKFCVDVGAGVVDADYRGEVLVLLINNGTSPYKVTHGDRIAQLILESIVQSEVVEVDTLEDTFRGSNGFGSTGK